MDPYVSCPVPTSYVPPIRAAFYASQELFNSCMSLIISSIYRRRAILIEGTWFKFEVIELALAFSCLLSHINHSAHIFTIRISLYAAIYIFPFLAGQSRV